ncbi:MAG: hypothetical protein US53_C0020G0011 [Candidatus Woesebacteria bacterium GW2011_GWA1_37_7]|uniref:Uncharacterized protein n=1 Tax=Candidatus Woesebacteria bacterium GW2011_GWA1_37_7 TaxID=1618545 RepID=A0A0G0H270_9BACT|nr:MAG: hypothetical protein US53_C0020G0011 [Candidatus Woesebacteria bacterium GW2011_GWA1_37_7]
MTKYKDYFEKMLRENKDSFDTFRKVHMDYSLDQQKFQALFNEEGGKIQKILREYENRLCANTERGIYNRYSTNLSEKFQNEVRKHFPLIDRIGIVIEKFSLKKLL